MPGLDDELRLLTAGKGHDLDLPDAHLVWRRRRPPCAVHGHPHRELAGGASPSDDRGAQGRQRVFGEQLESLDELVIRQRAKGPEDRGRVDGELGDTDRTHAVEQHPSHLCGTRRARDRLARPDQQVHGANRVVVEHRGQEDAGGGLDARELLNGLRQRLRARTDRLDGV
jgi:hypothetical protein